MNVAPTPRQGLERLMGFVNTVNLERTDPLIGPDELPQWLRETGLLPDPRPAELSELRRFREALRQNLEANAGHGDRRQAWKTLQPFAQRCSLKVEVRDYGPVLCARDPGECAVIGDLLATAFEAVTAGTWSRLKACRAQTCRWAFLDRSKNASGAWCSMAVCGNRTKARRRRQKRRKIAP